MGGQGLSFRGRGWGEQGIGSHSLPTEVSPPITGFFVLFFLKGGGIVLPPRVGGDSKGGTKSQRGRIGHDALTTLIFV